MLLAFLDYTVAVVAAEVGEPDFWDAPYAVSLGGSAYRVLPCSLSAVLTRQNFRRLFDGNVFGVCLPERTQRSQHYNLTKARKSPADFEILLKNSYICGIMMLQT